MGLKPKILTGLPAATSMVPRADFRPSEFDRLLVTKGYRMWWSRGATCPCQTAETQQPVITCGMCGGQGVYYFLPDPAVVAGATEDAAGNAVRVNDAGNAILIYVIMTSMTQDKQLFEKFGEWTFGTAKATTQAANKLGYRDRLTAFDSTMTWCQVIDYDGSQKIPVLGHKFPKGLRYPMVSINDLRTVTQVFREEDHFNLTTAGEIEFVGTPPAAGKMTVHGAIHPQWIVQEQMNAYRDSLGEAGSLDPQMQKLQNLPVQAVVKLDFLVDG